MGTSDMLYPRTFALLVATLGRDLAGLAETYFRPACHTINNNDWDECYNDGKENVMFDLCSSGCFEAIELDPDACFQWFMHADTASKCGYPEIVRRIVALHPNNDYWGFFNIACYGGLTDVASTLLQKFTVSDDLILHGFIMGCEYGHLEIVQLLIGRLDPIFINWGLEHACNNHHQNIIEFLIAHDATKCKCGKTIADHLHT